MSIQPYTLCGRKQNINIAFEREYDFLLLLASDGAGEGALGLGWVIFLYWDFPSGSVIKSLPANAGNVGDALIPGLGRPSREEMAMHSSVLAWRILWTEEPGGRQSMGSQRVRLN